MVRTVCYWLRRVCIWALAGVLLLVPMWGATHAQPAEDLPPCSARPGWRWVPRVDLIYFCFEALLTTDAHGPLPFTGLAYAPDSSLYIALPLLGEVWRLRDSDADGLPDAPQVVAQALDTPNALVFHNGALYIAGGPELYRLDHQNDALTVLADDLPVPLGAPITGILIASDERLYMGIPAACPTCDPQPQQGSVLRMTLDGNEREVIATGLRYPAALAEHDGQLYVTDSAPAHLTDAAGLDELNRLEVGADYGWPRCAADTALVAVGCAGTVAPIVRFQTGSTPIALVSYEGAAYPHLQGKLLLALSGAANRAEVRGFEVLWLDLAAEPPMLQTIMPFEESTSPVATRYNGQMYRNPTAAFLNQRDVGLYPRQVYSAAVSPQGWPTFSIGGGLIGILRPGDWRCEWVAGQRSCDNLHD